MDDEITRTAGRSSAGIWAFAFVFGMFGTGILARLFDLNSFWSMAVMVPPMLLLIPMVRATERRAAACGGYSPAIRAYNRRSLIWSFAYVIALFAAVTIDKQFHPTGVAAFAVATLPALPIFFFVWALGRYLVEESDEYIRMRQVRAALIATGILLSVATFWGFLETFSLVPHVPGWAAVPVWAIGLGVGNLANARNAA